MKRLNLFGLATLLVAGGANLSAQDAPQISGLLQVWYSQMLDSNLRTNSTAVTPNKYYNLRSEFQENGFGVRRAEIKIAGKVADSITYEVMFDPSISSKANSGTGSNNVVVNSNILQDLVLKYTSGPLEIKLGQMKNPQTYEGTGSSSELLFAERSQLGRVFGDLRDRGVIASYGFGDPKEFNWKISAGVFNGAVKQNDSNAQKDFVGRLDFGYGHSKFGVYTLQGSTDLADAGALSAGTFAGVAAAIPTATQVLDNKDKTSNTGAFYVYQDSAWHFDAEVMTGLLGRRNPSLGGAPKREHLDQKYFGAYATAAYTTGAHSFLVRYDLLNYNQGNEWYTATSPYVTGGADYTPKYTEITAGYTYAFNPKKIKAANFKLNYIARSKNFLKPLGTQTGEQGGDTLLAAFQIGF